jgi:hypothetical protein
MTANPPFPIPQGKSGYWEKVGGPACSDGDVRQWPGLPSYRPVPETHYLISLATTWVKDQNLDQPREFTLVSEASSPALAFLFFSLHPSVVLFELALQTLLPKIWCREWQHSESSPAREHTSSASSSPPSFATEQLMSFHRCQLLP